ncbi:hypothetical protein ABPG74_015791 [Tetrahymena malaccensis]
MDQIDFQKNQFQENVNQEYNLQSFDQSHQKFKQEHQRQDEFNSQQCILNQKQRQITQRQESLNQFQENSIQSVQDQFKNNFFRKCRTYSKNPSVISQQRSSRSNTSQIQNQNKEQQQKLKFGHETEIELESIFHENRKEKINRIANKPEFFSDKEWEDIPDDFEECYNNHINNNQSIKNNVLISRLQNARQKGNTIYQKSLIQQKNNRANENILNANLINNSTQQMQQRYQNIINDNYDDKDQTDDKSIYKQQLNKSYGQFKKETKQRSKSEDSKKVIANYYMNDAENLNQSQNYQKSKSELFNNKKIDAIISNQNNKKTKQLKTKNHLFLSKSLQDIDNQQNEILNRKQNQRFKTEPHFQSSQIINQVQEKKCLKLMNKQKTVNNSKDELDQGISFSEKINIVRRWIFLTFEDPSYSLLSKIICFFIQFTIILSCAIFILNTVYLTSDTEQNLTDGINFNTSSDQSSLSSQSTNQISDSVQNYAIFSIYAEFIVSIIFTVDLFLRLACCSSFGISVKAYLKQPINLIDLISIIPFYIVLIFQQTQVKQLYILRITRLLRIIQNHLTNDSLQLGEIDVSLQIQSIPQSFWFTLATMSTVGYGDKIPNTIPGKLVAMCIAFIGNALMIGLPIAIISYDFQVIYKEQKEMERFKSIKNKSIEQIKKLQSSAHASIKNFYQSQLTEENDNKEKSTNEQIQYNQSFEMSPQNHQRVVKQNKNESNNIYQQVNSKQARNYSFQTANMANQKQEQIQNESALKFQQNYVKNNCKNEAQINQNLKKAQEKQNVQEFQDAFLQRQNNESNQNQFHNENQERPEDKQKIHFKRTVSQLNDEGQENIQETELDDEYEAQIMYMADRLKQISKTNKAIRERTFQISKMSYVVTLDIARLYQTFSHEKKLQTNNLKEQSDIAYMAQKCENTKNSLLKQRFNSIIAFQKSVTNNLSTKISLNQFMQLNQASYSKKGTLSSNSQAFPENRNLNSVKQFHNQNSQLQRLSSTFNQPNQKFTKSTESIPRSYHYYQKEKNFADSFNFKDSSPEINDINTAKQNFMNQSNCQKNNSKSEFYRRFSEIHNQNKFNQQNAIYMLEEGEELSEQINQHYLSDCQSENFDDDQLVEEQYGFDKLQSKNIKNLHFIKEITSQAKLNEFKHKKSQKNIEYEQNFQNINQNTSLMQSNSKKSKNSTKQDSQAKQSQNSEQNMEIYIDKKVQNIQKQVNYEQNNQTNQNELNQQANLLNRNYFYKPNKQQDQMRNYLQKIDIFDDNNPTDQVSKVSYKIQKKQEDESLNDIPPFDKMKVNKIPSQQQIHFRNNFKENEKQQNVGEAEQRNKIQQGENNQLPQQMNRKASQLQNIIQDLLLNVSLDIQDQEEQKSQHIKSIRNIESQQQFKNLMKGDFSKELYYKVPQSQFQ